MDSLDDPDQLIDIIGCKFIPRSGRQSTTDSETDVNKRLVLTYEILVESGND